MYLDNCETWTEREGEYGKEIGGRAVGGREKSKTYKSTSVRIGAVCKSNVRQCGCRVTDVATEQER